METIYSLVTKPINQNVAIIRISGPDSFILLNKILKQEFAPLPNYVGYSQFFINNQFIDEGLILSFVAPNSFTGENVVEIQTHGSMEVIEQILVEFNNYKDIARPAKPGEFTKQSFLNKKMDLSKASAINNLIESENSIISNQAIKNISGNQSKYINNLIKKLEEILSIVQINIDYPENTDLDEYSGSKIKSEISILFDDISKVIQSSSVLQNLSSGIKIAVVGEPNAGKSTFINTILGEDRIIVSNVKGTTRDVIDVMLKIDGIPIILKDTAGIHEDTSDELEKIGIKKANETINEADIILYLQSVENLIEDLPFYLKNIKTPILKIATKSDLLLKLPPSDSLIYISSINGEIEELIKKLKLIIKSKVIINSNDFLIDKLQLVEFNSIHQGLLNIIDYIEQGFSSDYYLFEIENTLQTLYKIIGKIVDHDYINNLFGGFCLGK